MLQAGADVWGLRKARKMSGYESVFLCAVTRVVSGGWGGAGEGLGQARRRRRWVWIRGPSGEARPFTSACKKKAASAAVGLAALFVGDNGLKSTTDSLLRGGTEPASELIKQLLSISEGAAYLTSDARHSVLLQPCKRDKMKNKRKEKLLHF